MIGGLGACLLECARAMVLGENSWENPFGDGDTGRSIIEILRGSLR